MDAILAGSIEPGTVLVIRYEGPKGGPGHARDAGDHRRAEGRRPRRRLRADHRRPLQRRHVGVLHRPRRAGGRRRRPDRVRARRRPDPHRRARADASTCSSTTASWPSAGRRGHPTRRATPAACWASTPSSCRAPRPAPSPTPCRMPRTPMNLHEVLELIQLRRFERDPVQRLLNRTHMPDDFRAVAKRKLPRAVFDYVDGGADEEIAVARQPRGIPATQAEPATAARRLGHRPHRRAVRAPSSTCRSASRRPATRG